MHRVVLLDEFFEVRAEPHLAANLRRDEKGLYSVQSFKRLAEAAHMLVSHQYALYNDELMPHSPHSAQAALMVRYGGHDEAEED